MLHQFKPGVRGILLGALACAAFPTIALAQASADPAPPADAADANAAQAGVEDITVTARRREESLQDTPVSITAFSAAALDRAQVNTVSDISRFTPNLVLNQSAAISGNSSATTIFIRGIGQYDFSPTTEPAVGLYVDGVYVARSVGSLLDVADVERVEVLRGPQGTLFGRNTIGGAVNIVSKRPGDEFGGYVDMRVGSYDRIDAKVALDIPLSDRVKTRLSLATRNRDGYVRRIFDGVRNGDEDSWSGRFDILADVTDSLTARLIVDGTRRRENMAGNELTAVFPASGFVTAHNMQVAGPQCAPNPGPLTNPNCYNAQWISDREYRDFGTFESRSDLDLWGVNLTLEQQAGAVSFKSVTAYRDLDSISFRDGDHSPVRIFETVDDFDQWQFSQELQALGKAFDDRLNWVVGAYYFKEKGGDANDVLTSRIEFRSGGRIDNESIAGFAQGTFDITDRLSATAGLRYTHDRKRFTPDQFVTKSGLLPFPVGFRLAPHQQYSSSYDDFNPMADLSYKWTPEIMTYLRFAEGFKSGGYSFRFFPPVQTVPAYDPEYARVYEAGFKSTLLGGLARVNGAIFRTDYSNLQVSGIPQGSVGQVTVNGGKARIQGGELEMEARPVPPLRMQFGLGYLDTEYRSVTPGLGITDISLDSKLPYAPAWSLSGSASYEIATGIGSFTPQIDWSYRSKTYGNAANNPEATQSKYHVVNGSLTFLDQSEVWEVALGVTNIFDKRYFTTGYANRSVGYAEALFARPREWSLRVKRTF
ncbi:TonB-dependent receptor [Sphingomonas oleivorans]|uniref:TonB-dependent receptor n=2 Tax=Sphingomonas oleivorans TaxID=1735121 RepID=A0A2T5G362_9SPHN|nr:TonB-dependent receptor [Sphingomonas oleivorans]